MAGDTSVKAHQYDPHSLLNAQPVVVSLIDPATYEIVEVVIVAERTAGSGHLITCAPLSTRTTPQ